MFFRILPIAVMPRIRFQSNTTEILEGNEGNIACSAIGVPPPKYSWYKVSFDGGLVE